MKPRVPVSAGKASPVGKVSPARASAFEILTLVGEGRGNSDDLLHSARTEGLSPEDRNLTTALVMGVLRWQIALDARVAGLLSRPGQRLAEPVALALRMGVFQLLHMDRIPAHAALSESVELCRKAEHPHATGMVNAVLRKVASAPVPGKPIFEKTEVFAERLAHPLWLVKRWEQLYGREAAMAICEYGQREPGAGEMFVATDSEAPSESLPTMDDGSRLVAELAAVAKPAAARVWDCCAAPGGKALVLAKRLPEAEILASDVSARRLAQMSTRLKRYSYAEHVRAAVADAAVPGDAVEGGFDLILCDAPCSGTGTLARNPEIRLRLREEEFARQATRQRAILMGALAKLAPGGRLVYSTCSLEPEENEQVVDAVSKEAGLRVVEIGRLIAELGERSVLKEEAAKLLLGSAVRGGSLRTLPGVEPCDGFFVTVLERSSI